MPLWESAKDRFRDSRRQNIKDKMCPECRKVAHEARVAEDQRLKAEKVKKKRRKLHDRLPSGSKFTDLVWNAETGQWSGVLEVPGYEAFRATHTAVFRLLERLDHAYRRLEREQRAEKAKENTEQS